MSINALSQSQQMQGDLTKTGETAQNLDATDDSVTQSVVIKNKYTNPIYWGDNTYNEVRTETSTHTHSTDRVNENGDSISGQYVSTVDKDVLIKNINDNVVRLKRDRMNYDDQVATIRNENWQPGFRAFPNIRLGILVQTPNLVMITFDQYQQLMGQCQQPQE